jgi:predicted DNA-binding transcriptional regulator AlpA
MRQDLEHALTAARILPVQELPRLLGDLEEVRVTALARLNTLNVGSSDANDELLDVNEASRRLGMSASYLYHNSAKFTFTRRIGPRALRFSSDGIEKYIRARR